ncbi:hypothetical protein P154DRAFT_517409 [Amniculicola lignicola CBS 123094]|uniref:Uncharacterized protein n=1 Tax=Amniculicola lignicola CBS 123094 TaxID=1392246 RepID=A0A6A5X0V9_9PLEO|nr:hypothetical protein P154DRAFT_517409 [Amniculicola lignicola CBS 123094]
MHAFRLVLATPAGMMGLLTRNSRRDLEKAADELLHRRAACGVYSAAIGSEDEGGKLCEAEVDNHDSQWIAFRACRITGKDRRDAPNNLISWIYASWGRIWHWSARCQF